jgi:hypothetical protein
MGVIVIGRYPLAQLPTSMASGVAISQSNYWVPDRMFTVVISLQIISQATVNIRM